MEIKTKYYNALLQNDGRLNEIDLGSNLGLDEEETMRIISQLLMEYKIEYRAHYHANYRVIKKK